MNRCNAALPYGGGFIDSELFHSSIISVYIYNIYPTEQPQWGKVAACGFVISCLCDCVGDHWLSMNSVCHVTPRTGTGCP